MQERADDVQLVRATIRYQLEQEALRDNRGLALQRAIMVVVWQRQLLSRGSQFHAMRFNYMRHAFRLEVLRKHAVLRSIRLTLTWITERSRSMSSCVRHWRDNYLAGAPFMREKTRVEAAVATQGSKALVHEAIRPSQLFAALLLRTIVRDRNEAGVQQVAQANKAVLSQIEGCLIV